MPIPDELRKDLQSVRQSFVALYGREPGEGDLVFGHISDPTESVLAAAQQLLDVGIDPALVYAYVQTDGLLPTEFNQDKIPESDLALFEHYVEEYREPVDLRVGHVRSSVFVALGNELISSRVESAQRQLHMVLTDFLSRHMSDEQRGERMAPSQTRVGEFRVGTPMDYAMFSALKTKRTLESIQRLASLRAQESVYALARSVYENTVFLDAIADDPSVFWRSISPKADTANYTFGLHKDGRINYNHVIHRVTGERAPTNIRFSDIAQDPARAAYTRELYSLFYVTASQFAHVDVLSARAYFHDADPFDELDPELIARLVAVVLIGDFVRALVRIDGVQSRYSADASYLIGSLKTGFEEAFQYASSDPEHSNDVFEVLTTVVSGW